MSRRRVILSPVAEHELAEGIGWYGQQRKGLGKKLRQAIRETFQQIRKAPESHAILRQPNVRRALVDDFPYIILYRMDGANVRVMSVFHTSRDPVHWERTVDEDLAGEQSESSR